MDDSDYQRLVDSLSGVLDRLDSSPEDSAALEELLERKPMLFKRNMPISLPLYRAQIVKSSTELSHIRRFSYPPESLRQEGGRAHLPGDAVFYAAFDSHTAISEVIREYGDSFKPTRVWVSKWWPVRPYMVSQFVYDPKILESEISSILNSGALKALGKYLKQRPDKGAAFKRVCERLGNLFIADSYWVSARVGHRILQVDRHKLPIEWRWDGMIFPSVMKRHRGTNVVFTSDFVDECLRPCYVHEYLVHDSSLEGSNLSGRRIGLVDNASALRWYDLAIPHNSVTFPEVALRVATGMPFEMSRTALVEVSGRTMELGAFADEYFRPDLPELIGHLGTVAYDVDPSVTMRRPAAKRLVEEIKFSVGGQSFQATEIHVQVEVRPAFTPSDETF